MPEDFYSSENKVVISKENPKARAYLNLPFFCFLTKHNVKFSFCAQRSLPDITVIKPILCDYELKILHPDDYSELYGKPEWRNVVGSGKRRHLDKIAIGAFDGQKLIGAAGSGASCESMWQIGVDVLPGYRRKSVASALISRLALEILHIGIVPFTGNRWANIRSIKTQFSCGFRLAWVEIMASSPDTIIR